MKRVLLTVVAFLFVCVLSNSADAQTTYVWNQTGAASWAVSANWTPARTTPAPNDVLVFNSGVNTTPTNIPTETIGQLLISGNTIVNLQGGAAGTVLTISGLAAGADLVVDFGSQLNINVPTNTTTLYVGTGATASITGDMTFSAAAHKLDAADANVNAIVFNSPATFTQGTGCTGNIFTTNPGNNTVVFSSGSTFVQNTGANPFGLATPNSKVVFQTGSLYKFQQNSAPSFSGRTYANLEINAASFNQSSTGTGLFTVDNLTITQGILNLNLTTAGVNIKGNVLVAALQTLTFSPASASTVVFNGTSAQSITNNGTLTFGTNESVTINNSAGLTINSPVTFNNTVNFTSGIVTVPNPVKITFSNTAASSGATNNSFVDGKVEKIGNSNFTFPIGKAAQGLVPVAFDTYTGASATTAFTAEYRRGTTTLLFNNNFATGIDHVSLFDYWNIENTGTDVPDVNITLSWNALTSSNGSVYYINDFLSLIAARYNPGTLAWDSYSLAPVISGNVVAGTIKWNTVTMLGIGVVAPFALASTTTTNPLPVTINYLTAAKQSASNLLEWKLSCGSSTNVQIELQRAGAGKNYTAIQTMNATALRCQQPFSFTDAAPLAGTNNYRIKVTDANGKISYSTIAAIINSDGGFEIVNLLPSLVTSSLQVNLAAAKKTTLNVVITDAAGRPVTKAVYSLVAGSNLLDVNVGKLAAGMYYLTATTAEGDVRTVRFVKQ